MWQACRKRIFLYICTALISFIYRHILIFWNLNFIIHFIVGSWFLRFNYFNIAHVIGFGVMVLIMIEGWADSRWTDCLISMVSIWLTAAFARRTVSAVMVTVLRWWGTVHVWRIVLMMRHESMIGKMVVLIKVVCITCGAGLLIIDSCLIEMRLIQFEEGCCGDGHATGWLRTVIFTISVITSSPTTKGRRSVML